MKSMVKSRKWPLIVWAIKGVQLAVAGWAFLGVKDTINPVTAFMLGMLGFLFLGNAGLDLQEIRKLLGAYKGPQS